MVGFAGYHMPIQYEGIMAEHLWTRSNAGLFDVSHMGQLFLKGEDVASALEAIVPGDVKALDVGRMRYSLLLAEDGGILDDLMITRWQGGIYAVVNGAMKHQDIAHIEARLPEAVDLEHLEDRALLALQGPKAVEALARVAPGVELLTFMTGGMFGLAGTEAWISRSGYTGEDGFEISIPASEAERVADLLCEMAEVKPIGLGARDSLRLEAGLPLYGHDLDSSTSPVEADLGFALSKRRREEGGFPGHARIMQERSEGSRLVRVGLTIEGRQPVREGAAVIDEDGNTIGRVTSGGFSPSLERPIAMAYVPRSLAQPGTEILIEQRGKRQSASVATLPFVPHRYVRNGAQA